MKLKIFFVVTTIKTAACDCTFVLCYISHFNHHRYVDSTLRALHDTCFFFIIVLSVVHKSSSPTRILYTLCIFFLVFCSSFALPLSNAAWKCHRYEENMMATDGINEKMYLFLILASKNRFFPSFLFRGLSVTYKKKCVFCIWEKNMCDGMRRLFVYLSRRNDFYGRYNIFICSIICCSVLLAIYGKSVDILLHGVDFIWSITVIYYVWPFVEWLKVIINIDCLLFYSLSDDSQSIQLFFFLYCVLLYLLSSIVDNKWNKPHM